MTNHIIYQKSLSFRGYMPLKLLSIILPIKPKWSTMFRFRKKDTKPEEIRKSKSYKKATTKAKEYIDSPDRINNLLDDMRKKSTNKKGSLNKVWELLMTSFRLIKAYANGTYREISWQSLVMILTSIIYFVMPVDLIPDFLVGIGYLDDASLIAWTINTLSADIEKFAEWESQSES